MIASLTLNSLKKNNSMKEKQTENVLKGLARKYRNNRSPVKFNFKDFAIRHLKERRSNNYPHNIYSYPAKIYPYIPLFFLSTDELCPSNGIVLDPFAGSGTVLLESLINPFYKRSVLGVELNPIGRLISKVKTTPLDIESIERFLAKLKYFYKGKKNYDLPQFSNINLWFSRNAIKKLFKLKYAIEIIDCPDDLKDLLWLCLAKVVRKVSKADPFIPPPVLLKINKYKKSPDKYQKVKTLMLQNENPAVWKIFEKTFNDNLKQIRSLNDIKKNRGKSIKAKLIWDDARRIKKGVMGTNGMICKDNAPLFPAHSIDFIITSPPYLTAQKYIRTSKLELLWLGMDGKELRELDHETIGTEKISIKDIKMIDKIGINSIDNLITWAFGKSPKRAASVHKYFKDMQSVIKEMYRVLRNNSYAVLVVGNNKVLGKNIDTYRLLTDLALREGFKEILILKDNIRGRGMITKRHNSGGLIKEEFIIILKKNGI